MPSQKTQIAYLGVGQMLPTYTLMLHLSLTAAAYSPYGHAAACATRAQIAF